MSKVSTAELSREFWEIFRTPELPELGPGPRTGVMHSRDLSRRLLDWLAIRHVEGVNESALRATALLYHDHHDEAHDLVQDGGDADSALIHAILHRREPDFWNAKYWFRRVGDHPIYRTLADRLPELPTNGEGKGVLARLTLTGSLDPFGMVDEVERVSGASTARAEVQLLRRLQHAEFEVLVEHLLAPAG